MFCCYCSVAKSCPILCNKRIAACQATLSTISWSLLKYMSSKSVMLSNHLILCGTLLFFPSIFPSIRIFSNESDFLIRWPNYYNLSISPSNEYLGLISFSTDWFDLLVVPRNSQESSPAPQFKSISFSTLSLLYGPTLTYMPDSWKNRSFDCTELCWQNDIFAF